MELSNFSDSTDFRDLCNKLILQHIESYQESTGNPFTFVELTKIADELSQDLRLDADLLEFLRQQDNLFESMNIQQTYNCYQFSKKLEPISSLDLEHRQMAFYLDNFILQKELPAHIEEELGAAKDFFKHMYIRLKLLMNGWTDKNVENSIKCNCGVEWELQEYYSWLSLIRYQLKIEDIQLAKRTKGRPRVPQDVANIFKTHLNIKKKETISKKYQIYNILKHLPSEDYDSLVEIIDSSEADDEFKEKMTEVFQSLQKLFHWV